MGYLLKHSLSLDDQRDMGRGKQTQWEACFQPCSFDYLYKSSLRDLIILQPSNTLNGTHVLVHRDLDVEENICMEQEITL